MINTKSGSSTIEASLVIPILILIIVVIIKIAEIRESNVAENSRNNITENQEILEDTVLNVEDILRGYWSLK